ncbi:MAG: hypothetical protein AAFU85_03700 [Planctomycetota bacterium]
MFRILCIATLTLLRPDLLWAQEYAAPFEPITASESTKLVVLLISDEDAAAWSDKTAAADDEGTPALWCEASFRRSVREAVAMRPELRRQLVIQRFAAGKPAILTGGATPPWPRRAVTAITDVNYRLLALAVGVPRTRDFAALLEDAEETRTMLNLYGGEPKRLGESIAERAIDRVDRAYTSVLRAELADFPWAESLAADDPSWSAKYARVANEMEPVYRFDARLRFELNDTGDPIRLRALEQHTEPRSDWCLAVAPFIVGRPATQVLPAVIDSIWMETPHGEAFAPDREELTKWFNSERENSLIVLAIEPPLLHRQRPWPPPEPETQRRAGRGWKALETAMSKHAFHTVDAPELTLLLEIAQTQPIELNLPRRVRYIFLERGSSRAFPIREGDLPAKFLKRF